MRQLTTNAIAIFAVFSLLISVPALGEQEHIKRRRELVQLEIVALAPVTSGRALNFRIRAKLSNGLSRAILVEAISSDSKQPDFVKLEKRIAKRPFWQLVWGYQDVPASHAIEVAPRETLEFEFVVPSVAGSRDGWLEIRGLHRARLRYFRSREDFERYRSLQRAPSCWVFSGSFNIDWPAQTPQGHHEPVRLGLGRLGGA